MKEKVYFGNKVNVPKLCKTKKGWLLFSTSLLIGIGIQSINYAKADVINDVQVNLENKNLSQINYPNNIDNNNVIKQENKTITSDDKTNIKIDFDKTGVNQATNEDSVTYEVSLKDNIQTNNVINMFQMKLKKLALKQLKHLVNKELQLILRQQQLMLVLN